MPTTDKLICREVDDGWRCYPHPLHEKGPLTTEHIKADELYLRNANTRVKKGKGSKHRIEIESPIYGKTKIGFRKQGDLLVVDGELMEH